MTVLDPTMPALQDIATPALVVDGMVLQNNIAAMADFAKANGIALRPHAKTHKSPRLAQLQIEAGAVGISCATVAEMEAMAEAGMPGLLLTTPVADRVKLARIAALADGTDISLVVDHPDQIHVLHTLLDTGSRPVQVLIDIDVGQRRTGVVEPAATLALAQLIEATPGMTFGGIQGFAGHVQHMIDDHERKAGAAQVRGILDGHLRVLNDAGIKAPIVTGSGTGAYAFDIAGTFTELQVGSYLFMDADYGRLRVEGGGTLPFEPSLFVLATVTSVNRAGEFTVDAGVKAMAFNGPVPSVMLGVPEGSTYRFGGDEHGMITLPEGAEKPKLGSRVLLIATHCDPTVNLHASYHVVGHNGSVKTWPVMARYGA
ncbi:DSD1 family PLP-dependent enzyme [Rhodopseudomonas boonkerdii]|uniref:DSD1 family PLP-dependent enzyme n=1 Tax=Rhodopseudomonas boonkerdii TaxID=475937 RepID=UPI001E33B002|nr:DSD1 family PLP-dependent enzyme [Rhodopseudomonas boonkerdii]UGV27583.1 DSD1 family PLP-dependent enzyme [Rhodopseudomonas boonkerdii]